MKRAGRERSRWGRRSRVGKTGSTLRETRHACPLEARAGDA
ncbi:hypothetical protein PSMK_06860 [Phycisphaera mikurensis NBRC 102666]|uniref:Uncharacterized protein n=1 Tax=Phycisphaera mikurensis (strain NBRC 102666 / KCTC 22515 / FYK2301M01) TaxID=1142394 RepID=I0IC57_PHYMF|nr:hypothetical protein PSMK_06860 [Phycisphaera mikurensis NBRC 102666]